MSDSSHVSSTISLRNLTPALYDSFMANPIRPDDLLEWAEAGLIPKDHLPVMLQSAVYIKCAVDDSSGLPVCVAIWAVNVSDGIGTIMLIGADRPELVIPIHQEFSRDEWHRVKLLAPVLQAFPSVKNKQHHKWLEHFAFKKEGAPMVLGKGKYQRYVCKVGE
jgi:hypothetical protein